MDEILVNCYSYYSGNWDLIEEDNKIKKLKLIKKKNRIGL